MKQRILLVDDEPKIVDVMRLYLERERYEVFVSYDGLDALALARMYHPHLAVLDWLMPQISGLDLCRILRAESAMPIMFLTAKSGEEDTLLGFDQGVDDYITKPFRPREVVARIRALLRRAYHEEDEEPTELHCGDLVLNLLTHEARRAAIPLALTPTEFTLLATMMREPGRVFRREELVRRIFGSCYEGMERTIDVHIMNARRKIEPDSMTPVYVHTVYGIGYKCCKRTEA